MLDAHGLSAASGHFALAMLEGEPDRVVAIARRLGMAFVVGPYLPPAERPATVEGWKALGARLVAIEARLSSAGLRFAWHNHDFEFQPLEDGSFPIEHLLGDACSGRRMSPGSFAEAPIRDAGSNAIAAAFRWCMSRISLPPARRRTRTAGLTSAPGLLPWRELWPVCVAAGAETMIAEHDNPSDFERFVRVSADPRCAPSPEESDDDRAGADAGRRHRLRQHFRHLSFECAAVSRHRRHRLRGHQPGRRQGSGRALCDRCAER